jgi:sulfate transport system substrate-binding protein
VVANPKTAGVARWIFLGLWGHKMRQGEAAAVRYVTKVFDNVEIMPRDAREASDVFYTQGFGDVLLTYENEAVFTNLVVSPQAPLPFTSPPNNVRVSPGEGGGRGR